MIFLYAVIGLLAALAVPVLIGMSINFVQGRNPKNQHRPNIRHGDSRCAICEKFLHNRVHDNSRREERQQSDILDLEKWHADFRQDHPEFEDVVRNEMFPELAPPPKSQRVITDSEMTAIEEIHNNLNTYTVGGYTYGRF